MAAVGLRDLLKHITDAKKIADTAMDSVEETPKFSFEQVRRSLRAALALLGESESESAGAADSAHRRRARVPDIWQKQPDPKSDFDQRSGARVRISDVFPTKRSK